MKTKDDFTEVPFEKLPGTKAWKLTSFLVRLKADGICYTCGRSYPFSKLNAGHFREKRGNAATYFDRKRNLRAQCFYCNFRKHGAKDIYAKKLVEECGPEVLSDLFREGQKSKKWNKGELKQIEKECEEEIEEFLCKIDNKNNTVPPVAETSVIEK